MIMASESTVDTNSSKPDPPGVEIHVFACGHGDTILLRLPMDRWVLIDCHLPEADGTRARFFGFVESLNISRLDFIILTHPDLDHYLGMTEVLTYFANKRNGLGVFCDSGPTAQRIRLALRKSGWKTYRRLIAKITELHASGSLRRRWLHEGSRFLSPQGYAGRIDLVPIAPEAGTLEVLLDKGINKIVEKSDSVLEANNLSIVLMLTVGHEHRHFNFLLAADSSSELIKTAMIEWSNRAKELHRAEALHALKLPHHGSWHSHAKQLCLPSSPKSGRVACISAGDRTGLPDRRVVMDFLEHGWNVLITRPRKRSNKRAVVSSAPISLIDRSPARSPSGDFDLILKWSGGESARWGPKEAEITTGQLNAYDAADSEKVKSR
jgi:beta-lactamase superfamily II metal-dependent hydrolase